MTWRAVWRWTSRGWNWHGRGHCRDFLSRYIGPSTVVVAVCEHGGAAADTVLLGALGLVASVQANTSLLMCQWTSLRVWERKTGLTSVRTGLEGSSSPSAGLCPCHLTTVALLRPLCYAVLGHCTLVGASGPQMVTMMVMLKHSQLGSDGWEVRVSLVEDRRWAWRTLAWIVFQVGGPRGGGASVVRKI